VAVDDRVQGRAANIRDIQGCDLPSRSTSDTTAFMWLAPTRTLVPGLRPMQVKSVSSVFAFAADRRADAVFRGLHDFADAVC
jgi:hypothetical protein